MGAKKQRKEPKVKKEAERTSPEKTVYFLLAGVIVLLAVLFVQGATTGGFTPGAGADPLARAKREFDDSTPVDPMAATGLRNVLPPSRKVEAATSAYKACTDESEDSDKVVECWLKDQASGQCIEEEYFKGKMAECAVQHPGFMKCLKETDPSMETPKCKQFMENAFAVCRQRVSEADDTLKIPDATLKHTAMMKADASVADRCNGVFMEEMRRQQFAAQQAAAGQTDDSASDDVEEDEEEDEEENENEEESEEKKE